MTTPIVTIGPRVTVHAAGRLMSSRHVRLLPVVDKHNNPSLPGPPGQRT